MTAVSASTAAPVAWPNNLPDPRYFPRGGVAGLRLWMEDAPAGLKTAIDARVIKKVKPSDKDYDAVINWHDLFTVYAVCNFDGRAKFLTTVAAVTAEPISGIDARKIPVPACIPLVELYPTVAYLGVGEFVNFCSPAAASAFEEMYKGKSYLDHVPTVRVNALYNLMDVGDRQSFYQHLQLSSPARLVETPPAYPPIGPADPPPVPPPRHDPTPPPPPPSGEVGRDYTVPPPARGGILPVPDVDTSLPNWANGHLPRPPVADVPPFVGGPDRTLDSGAHRLEIASTAQCYLAMVVPTARGRFAGRLGSNPWAPAVAAELLAEPGVWQPGRFRLTICAPAPGADGPAFNQAHVEPASNGLRVKEILPFLVGFMRLGMASSDLSALLSLQAESSSSTVASVFDIKPAVPGTRVQLGLTAKLNAESPALAWNVFSTPALALMLGIYESVRLESVDFVVTISPGMTNTLWAAATSANIVLQETSDWLSAPVTNTIHGSSTGVVRGTFGLPAGHQFAKEIRMATMGNTAPTFHFNYQGVAGSSAILTGTLVVHVSGAAVLGHVNIGAKMGKQSAMLTARGIARTLGYSVQLELPKLDPADCAEESEEEEEEEAAVAEASSPRASPPAEAAASRPPRGN